MRDLIPFAARFCIAVLLISPYASAQESERSGRQWPVVQRVPDEDSRQRMLDRLIDGQLRLLTRQYKLTETQQEEARARLREIRAQHEVYAAPMREEFTRLGAEYRELRNREENGEEIDRARLDEIRERLGDIRMRSPLFNMETVREEIELLIPPEQAEEGRRHWEEMNRLREQRRQEGVARGAFAGAPQSVRLDPWERYVDNFIREYKLDEAQQESARSVLRAAKAQRETHEKNTADQLEAARSIEDPALRIERLAEVYAPARKMFDALKSQLNHIPTEAQKQAAIEAAATRPAGALRGSAATRPSVSSRPAE